MGLRKPGHRDSGHLLILEMEAEPSHWPSGSFLNLKTWGAHEWLPRISFFLPFTPTSVRFNFARKTCYENFKNMIFFYTKPFLKNRKLLDKNDTYSFIFFIHFLLSHSIFIEEIYKTSYWGHKMDGAEFLPSVEVLTWAYIILCYSWNTSGRKKIIKVCAPSHPLFITWNSGFSLILHLCASKEKVMTKHFVK